MSLLVKEISPNKVTSQVLETRSSDSSGDPFCEYELGE